MAENFSDRYGYRGTDAEITIREDAPDGLRFALLAIAKEAGLGPKSMREAICQVLREPPNPNNWSYYPDIWEEAQWHLQNCPWDKVYDIAEAFHRLLWHGFDDGSNVFEDKLNQYFREHGIGWQMDGGQNVYRGSEAFSGATQETVAILEQSGRSGAAREIHKALRDISRRPKPDVTGAIQHAYAAMEATARDVMGDASTFSALAKRLSLPRPLDTAAKKLWAMHLTMPPRSGRAAG
jgi:hypothetical protein